MLLESVLSPLACWISSSGTVCGNRPFAAGRKNASAVPNSASIAISSQILTTPAKISAASRACRAKRTRSVTTITRWRGSRSAHTPPISRNATSGRLAAANTSPRSVASPVSSITNSASATITMQSPITLADCANHR